MVKEALVRGDFTNCFTKPVSALSCAEPIVVLEGAFSRTSRIDGECEVAFTLFDPVAYGMGREERTLLFEVGGTWPTLPVVEVTASAGASVQVSNVTASKSVLVEKTFEGGETVVVDCVAESVTIGGADSRNKVALGSDFFALEPGACELAFAGCSDHVVRFRERWA